jgi:hypothetical protein
MSRSAVQHPKKTQHYPVLLCCCSLGYILNNLLVHIKAMQIRFCLSILLLLVVVAADHGGDNKGGDKKGGDKKGGGNKSPKPTPPPPPPPRSPRLPHNETGTGKLHNRTNSTHEDDHHDERPRPNRPHSVDNSLEKSKPQASQESLAQLLHDGGGRPNISPRLPGAERRSSDQRTEVEKSHPPRGTPVPPPGDRRPPPGGRPRPHGEDS